MRIDVSINGDCISAMKEMEDNSIDLVIADPPYWKVVGENGIINGKRNKIT